MTTDGWAKVPAQLILSDLPAGAVRLYGYLAWRQGQNESAWPSWETMIADLGVSRRALAYQLGHLERAGWIARDRSQGAVNHYVVTLDGATNCTSAKRDTQRGAKRDTHEVDPLNKKHLTRAKKTRASAPGKNPDPRVREMQVALAEVCGVDMKISRNWGWLGREATALLDAGYTPENVQQFATWWRSDSWRATHTPVPNVRVLRERIGQAIHGVDSPAGPTAGAAVIDLGYNDESVW